MRSSRRTAGNLAVTGFPRPQPSLWLCPIGDRVAVEVDPCCYDVLSAQERQRLLAFRFTTHQREYLHSHFFLRRILSTQVKAEPTQLRFTVDSLGKPWLEGSCLNFNLSHTAGLAACCASAGDVCGVDVERHRPLPDMDLIAERNFSVAERTLLQHAAPKGKEVLFYRIWTLKEAYIKACGLGLSMELTSFSVLPQLNGTAELRLANESLPSRSPWSIYWWSLSDGFHVSAAFAGPVGRPPLTLIRLEDFATKGGCHEKAH